MATFLTPASRLLTLGLTTAGLLTAQDLPIVGPRALGMGGTGVSSCDDHTASFYNPAMLGFFGQRGADDAPLVSDNNDLGRKHWGVGLDVTVGYTVIGRLSEILAEIQGANLRGLARDGIQSPNDLQRLATVARAISDLGDSGNAVIVDANSGIGVRIGRWGLGARIRAQSSGFVTNTDLASMVLNASGPTLATNIVNSGAPNDDQVDLLSSEQAQSLYVRLGGDATQPVDTTSQAWQAVECIDYAMRQAGISGTTVNAAYSAFQNAAAGTGTDINDNATYVSLAGFACVEIPVSYGFPINEHWAVGATVKGLIGRVYRNQVSVFDNTAKDSLGQTTEAYDQSFDVGIDLSVAARTQFIQAGLIVRNINSPTFPSPSVNGRTWDSVVLEPQATISESIIPWDWCTVAIDLDINAVETTTPGYHMQRLGVGAEINPWHVLALRCGAYRNIADGNAGSVVTLGAGLNLWAVRIDAALAASPHTMQVLEWELPEEMRASLGIMADF